MDWTSLLPKPRTREPVEEPKEAHCTHMEEPSLTAASERERAWSSRHCGTGAGKRRVSQRSGRIGWRVVQSVRGRLHTRRRSPQCAGSSRTLTQHCVDAAVNLLLERSQVGGLGCEGAELVNSRHDDDDETSRKGPAAQGKSLDNADTSCSKLQDDPGCLQIACSQNECLFTRTCGKDSEPTV